MPKIVSEASWQDLLSRGDLVGSVIETEEHMGGTNPFRSSGVIIDIETPDGCVFFTVQGADPSYRYEVGGQVSLMDLYVLDDGSFEFILPYIGRARILASD